jgi:Protein kinase domain
MGAVYKARQPALDRLVALKILPAQTAPDPGFAERFTREARALARLSHPNIVAVHEFGQVPVSGAGVPPANPPGVPPVAVPQAGETPAPPPPSALPYFIMEFVDGVNLRQLQRAGRLSPREALQIVPQICDALQYAHDEGVVHRDIKPENVLIDRKGRVKIADFGLAKIMKGGDASPRRPADDPQTAEARAAGPSVPAHLTEAGQVMGTPHYMAPEQIEHPQDVDHRADIYSLGVVFYEMLTGELPLGKFQPPSRKVQVDVRLDEVVLHALEKEPERRYQQASQLSTDVQGITAAPTGAIEPTSSGLRAWKIAGAVILALVAVNFAIVVVALRPALSKPQPSSKQETMAQPVVADRDALLQFRWVAGDGDTNTPAEELPYTESRGRKTKLRVLKEIVMDGSAVASAGLPVYRAGETEVSLALTADGERKFAQATAANIHRQLAVVWQGRVLFAPVIQSAITTRELKISGNFSDAEAQQLVAVLNHRGAGVTSPPGGSTLPAQTSVSDQLAEPPMLRFLAWQDEWQTNQPGAARHPDGSPVTDPAELNLLREVRSGGVNVSGWKLDVEPRFLHLWFSYPPVGRTELNEVSLLDGTGKPIQSAARGSWFFQPHDPDDRNGNLGWFTATLSPGDWTNLPAHVTVRLTYTVGPLERSQEFAITPNRAVSMTLGGGGTLSDYGQNMDGTAFLAIMADVVKNRGRRFDAAAVTKEGREIPSKVTGRLAWLGTDDGVRRFEFTLPLADVAKFVIGTRPIRTNEWRDVVLPHGSSVGTKNERARLVKDAPFSARLSQGAIELVALSYDPSTNQPWWQADGAAWTNAAFENSVRHTSDVQQAQRFEFVFHRFGLPTDVTLEYNFEPSAMELDPADQPLIQGKTLPDHNLIAALLPESAKVVTIKVGVAAGEWKKMASRTPQTGGGASFSLGKQTCTALFLDPVESGGESRVGVSYNLVPGWTTRVTALDTSGKLHESFPYRQSVGNVASAEGRFAGLSLSQVKEFRFEARPYAWVEFRNVSLQPGVRTLVEVIDAEGN